jgi:hypothetical protein
MEPNQKQVALHIVKRMKENIVVDPEWPRVNAYVCSECGEVLFTVDCIDGTTPAFLKCIKTNGCKGRMSTAMYSLKPVDYEGEEITHEWVVPNLQHWRRMVKYSLPDVHHVANGGLILQTRTSNPILCHNGRYVKNIGEPFLDVETVVNGLASVRTVRAEIKLWLDKRKRHEHLKAQETERRIANAKKRRRR